MNLKEIVPEYHSKNIFIRTLFLKRLKIAIQLAWSKLGSGDDLKVGDKDKSSSSPTESRLRDEGGKESEALFDFAKARVVDLGCGEGKLLGLIEENFKNVKTFGIDVEPNVLELKKFLKAEIKIADIRESGFPDNFFDTAFCLDVLEHFKDLEKPIKEIKRILKPDGLLIVSLPTENWFYKLGRLFTKGTISEKAGPCSSPHFHNAKTIEIFLNSNGFVIVKKILLPLIPSFSLFRIVSLSKRIN